MPALLSPTHRRVPPFLTPRLLAVVLCFAFVAIEAAAITKPGAANNRNQAPRGRPDASAPPLVPVESNVSTPTQSSTRTVTLAFEKGPLALILREIARSTGANLILMGGIEDMRGGPFNFKNATADTMLQEIAKQTELKMIPSESYVFLFPAGYEVLDEWDLSGRLADNDTGARVDVSIGGGTPLYSALALLSHSLDGTLVADNAIAESTAGELHLNGVSLPTAIEALLKSARVVPGSVIMETGPGYLFLRSRENAANASPLLNSSTPTGPIADRLTQTVSFTLPEPVTEESRVRSRVGAVPLRDLLPVLSEQLGVPVTATPDAGRVPVNPMAVRGISGKTALDLLARQWLVPVYGYEITESGVHFRRR